MVQQQNLSLGDLILRESRSYTHAQTVGLPRTVGQLVTEAATYTTHKTNDEYPCPQQDSNPQIPAVERPQTYAFCRAAIGISMHLMYPRQRGMFIVGLGPVSCVCTVFISQNANCVCSIRFWIRSVTLCILLDSKDQ